MVQTALEKESKEESLFMEDLCSKLREARVFAQDTLEKLRCFCEKSGRRKISELNEILDSTELNDFIRLVFNEDHPTLDSKDQIRKLDYEIERCTLSGEKQIRASEKKGLSFCRSLEKLVDVIKIKHKANRSKRTEQNVHVYIINENAALPHGLSFVKDTIGHVSLIATQNMSWNEMIRKLNAVNDMLEYYVTIRIEQ